MEKKLNIYIGFSKGYNGTNNLLNKNFVISETLKVFNKYTYGLLKGFNVTEITFYDSNNYVEPSLLFSIGFNNDDFNDIKAILNSALTELKGKLEQESIYYEILNIKGNFV